MQLDVWSVISIVLVVAGFLAESGMSTGEYQFCQGDMAQSLRIS